MPVGHELLSAAVAATGAAFACVALKGMKPTASRNEKLLPPLSVNACDAEPPMALRSPVTVMPLLAGLLPGVTVTVIVLEAPGRTAPGFADATPVGGVDAAVTVRAIDVVPARLCASVIVTGSVFAPAVVLLLTVATNEN